MQVTSDFKHKVKRVRPIFAKLSFSTNSALVLDFISASSAVSRTRTLTFHKRHINGSYFDLEAIWEEHTEYEFGKRSVANTMGTMAQGLYMSTTSKQ